MASDRGRGCVRVVLFALFTALSIEGCGGGSTDPIPQTPDASDASPRTDSSADRSETSIDASTDAPADIALDLSADVTPDRAVDVGSCMAPRQTCGSACVDTSNDVNNCGSCGIRCAAGQVCGDGKCTLTCPQGLTLCQNDAGTGGSCVETRTDTRHCGTCNRACAPGEVCSAGTCSLYCQSGLVACGGRCIDPTTDRAFCGATGDCTGMRAGRVCPSGEVCSNGACQLSCQQGFVNCDGTCIDPANSLRFCGASGNCTGANSGAACTAGQVCSNGSCQLSCQTGLVNCGGKCVDPSSDRAHCGASGSCTSENAGASCAAGQVCVSGACTLSCQQGLINCNGLCIDPQNNRQHCGASGNCSAADGSSAGTACGSGQVCSLGTCQVSCLPGQIACNSECIDPQTNRQFCGASGDCTGTNTGAACTAGQVCSSGSCQLSCQSGLVACNGTCIDPASSLQYCGASGDCTGANSGTACSAGQVCSNGTCSLSCQSGLIACGGTCIDPASSRQFCGATGDCAGANAGAACTAGQVCLSGACVLSCQQGLVNCGGTCIDPLTSRQYCGASGTCSGTDAGTACAAGLVCANGACAVSCQQGLVNCGGTCVDPANNRQYCGATGDCMGSNVGTACAAGQVCTNGSCEVSCQVGQVMCSGTCVDPSSNRQYCGASGDCSGSNAGTACDPGSVCSNGVCQLSCQGGLVNCGGTCVDPASSRSFCGATGDCAGANAGQACADGQVCLNGTCSLSCQQGLVNCGNTCIDPASNRTYCGASGDCTGPNAGQTCGAGDVCTLGQCTLSCQPGLVNCNGTCIDPSSNRSYCGSSGDCSGPNAGQACGDGQVCNAGTCSLSCQAGLVNCGGTCVDPANNRDHCGASGDCLGANAGQNCGAGQVCSGSTCSLSCQSGLVNCGGTCINPGSSNQYCGASGDCAGGNAGVACPVGQTCSGGTCQLICTAGTTACGMECINTQTNRDHCGMCSNKCNSTDTCVSGMCVAGYRPVGVQTNVPVASLAGWTQCYTGTYAASNVSLAGTILTQCSGANLMMACRPVGSSTLTVLAWAPRADVIFNTGDSNNVTHNANGVEWYYSNSYSWGFVNGGNTVNRFSCDTANTNAATRLCWHTSGGTLNVGWRCGATTGLNGTATWERIVYQSN